jgi:outer membrane protein assembly factor BamA
VIGLVACGAPASPRVPLPSTARACRTSTDIVGLDHIPDGAKVTHVDVRGTGIDASVIVPQLQTKAGAKLDRDVLSADVRWLWRLGVASQIAVSAEPRNDGYEIELALQPPLRVHAVELVGATRDQLPMLAALDGTLHDPSRLQRVTAAAAEWLRGRGYPHATITAVADADCDGIVVHVDAELHDRVTISRLAVTGTALPTTAATFEHELAKVNVVGGIYNEPAFIAALDAVVEHHHDHGYLDATLDRKAATYHGTHVAVTAVIAPGPRYKLGALPVTGGTAAAQRIVDAKLQPLRHQWFDELAFDAAVAATDDELDALGFRLTSQHARDNKRDVYEISFTIAKYDQ